MNIYVMLRVRISDTRNAVAAMTEISFGHNHLR